MNAKNPSVVKSIPFKQSERVAEHDYAMQTERVGFSAKRGSENLTPTNTPGKKNNRKRNLNTHPKKVHVTIGKKKSCQLLINLDND